MKIIRNILKLSIIVFVTFFVIYICTPPLVVYRGRYQVYENVETVGEYEVGIVFGAGVKPEGVPSDMLEDRLLTAEELYRNGKVEKILVSGDNSQEHYNEPQVMYDYLVEKGVPEDRVIRDYAGRRTYDTCYRAKEIFGVDKALLISQGYHLPRSIYLCESFDIESTGYSATRREYLYETFYESREVIALYWSTLDIYVFKPTPILGEKEEI